MLALCTALHGDCCRFSFTHSGIWRAGPLQQHATNSVQACALAATMAHLVFIARSAPLLSLLALPALALAYCAACACYGRRTHGVGPCVEVRGGMGLAHKSYQKR